MWDIINILRANNGKERKSKFAQLLISSICCCSVVKLCLTLWPKGLQHSRLPCPALSPRVCSDLCPLSQWCYLTISSCHAHFLLPSIFSSIRVFSNELALYIRWLKNWSFSFSISPSICIFFFQCIISRSTRYWFVPLLVILVLITKVSCL